MEAESWVDRTGEWRTKGVSIMGVVSSFLSQLKPGQDMTRVSLPAILLYPFSILEVFATRELSNFDMVLKINDISSPVDRMITVVEWFCATLPMDIWRKKPYNPVIGEVHECWTESPKYGKTHFLAEQVSHHPPISAIHIHNPQEDISLSESLSFGVSFGGNSLNIQTLGSAALVLNKLKETYIFEKKVPNMLIKQLIIGSKKHFWEGDVTISSEDTGFTASLNFYRDGDHAMMKGTITSSQNKDIQVTLDGRCGGTINIAHGKEKKKPLVELDKISKMQIRYPLVSQLDPLSSLAVWAPVTKLGFDGKPSEADEAKKRIEEDQRQRLHACEGNYETRYFHPIVPSTANSSANPPITTTPSGTPHVTVSTKWEINPSAFNSAKFGREEVKEEAKGEVKDS